MKSPIHRKNYKIELFSPKNYLLKVFLLLRNKKNIMHLLMHMKYLPWIKRTTSRQPVLKLNGHNHLITKVIKIVHPTTVFSYYIPKLFKDTSKWIINLRIYHLHKYTGWSNKKWYFVTIIVLTYCEKKLF